MALNYNKLWKMLIDKNMSKSELVKRSKISTNAMARMGKNEDGMIDHYPQTVGLDIQIDVLGIIVKGGKSAIAFIEAKKTQLNLHDLGQLWAYCKLCDPAEAFLLSSAGIGSLNKILNNLSRTDLLDFGDGRKIKKMQVAKWDITSNSIDFRTLVPRI